MKRNIDAGSKILVTYLIIIGLSICTYWLIQISGGFLFLGMDTVRDSSYITWHVVAELITGIIAVFAAYLMLIRHPTGYRLAMFACGLLLYTSLNSIGWGLLHDPGLLVIYIISSLGSLYGFVYILSRDEI